MSKLFTKLNIQRFASGTIYLSTWTGSYNVTFQGKLEISSTSNGSTANTSNVTVNLYARKQNSSGVTTGKSWSGSIGIDGTTSSFSSLSSSTSIGNSWVLVHTYTKYDVPHNSDGTRTITISGSIKGPSGTNLANATSSGSDSFTLDFIPRASQPSVSSSSVNLGSSVTIYTNWASSSFSHTITTSVGGSTIETFTGIGASKSWTPAIATYAPYITSSDSATCTITCYTYSGGTLIGTKTCTISLIVPSSVKPSVSISLSEGDSTMRSLAWGVYVQGKSKLSVSLSASTAYGSAIKSYNASANGTSYSSSSFTTGVLSGSGSVSASVTDNRNHVSNTATQSYSVVAYSNPAITATSVSRCLSNGTDSDEGTYVKYTFKASISPVSNKNAKLFRLGYKASSASSYTYVTLVNNAYSINQENIVLSGVTFDINTSYDFVFQAIDTFTTSSSSKQIGTSFDLMNFNSSGKSMAIGKVSEAGANEELLEIGIDTEYKGMPLLEYEIVDTW